MNMPVREKLPIRLLYVEDEHNIRLPMLEMMSRWVQDIIVATDGKEGLEAFAQTGADLVITDLKMPNMGGLEMVSQIKALNPDVKTIIVSAHNDTNYFLEAIHIGVDGFLMKPVMRDKLSESIQRFGRIVMSQRNARLQESKFMALAGSLIDAIVIVNEKGEITFLNHAAYTIFGFQSNEASGLDFSRIFDSSTLPDTWPRTSMGLKQFFREGISGSGIMELNCRTEEGRVFPAEISISPLNADNVWYAIFIIRDISERKQRENELIQARENAEAATRAKQQFLSVMSHEIRTPLNGILGTINLLSQEEPRADQLDYLQTLEFSGSHLLSLVNDILDFSKIEANRIQFENIDFSIRNIVNTLLKIFAYKCADKGVELIAEIDPSVPEYVQGDSVRLNQILTNLIGNAVKFTEKGSIRVKVSTIGNRPESLTCQFEVIDTGIGIPLDKQEEIFDLFSQADSDTTRRFGGTGLGLAITRKLIEFQGGKISVDSEPEKGSRFYYQLDFGISHTSHDLDKSSANRLQPLTGVKVLLVEDNKINQMIATKFLNRWEAVVDIAENGQEALEKIRRMDYHIVLMDLQMPVMDGYQASREIRSLEGEYFQHIPIIALTASTFNEVRENLIKFGLDDIINKPFIPEDLNNKIHGYLNSGRL